MEGDFDDRSKNATKDDDESTTTAGAESRAHPASRDGNPSRHDLYHLRPSRNQGSRKILGVYQWVENVETYPIRQYTARR